MSICWFCHWGWPKPIRDIYDRAREEIDDILLSAPCEANDWTYPEEPATSEQAMNYGPGHVVWSDENFELAASCLKDCDEPHFADWYPPAMEAVRRSLRELDALPPELKEPPKDYDGENPEHYPPPADWIMVKK